MTIDELAAYPKATVGTKIAAPLLGVDRYALNIAAKNNRLNIPFFFSGNRLHISRTGLLEFLGYYKEKALEAQTGVAPGLSHDENRFTRLFGKEVSP